MKKEEKDEETGCVGVALMMLSCVALGEGEGLHYLSKEDIAQIYNPDALASYQDDTMAEPVVSRYG